MEWRDEGVVVAVRKHGETSAIIEVLTETHGRHAGVVRGGVSRKMTPVLQPGNQVSVEWRARLEEHLGSFKVELVKSRSAVLSERQCLAALASVTSLVSYSFPERMELPSLYETTISLLDQLVTNGDWWPAYALWELQLLEELGFGIDLTSCAASGVTQELIYVSPKSGRAVSRVAGEEWSDRLLPLPVFLKDGFLEGEPGDVLNALKTTGYFLNTRLSPALGNNPLPPARDRLLMVMRKAYDRSQKHVLAD